MSNFFAQYQVDQLLKPIHPSRVAKDPKGMAYVEQHEIRAHLNRIFGFGNWEMKVTRLDLVFEQPTVVKDKQTGQPKPDRWDAAYSASVRLTVRGSGQSPAIILETDKILTADSRNRLRDAFKAYSDSFPAVCNYEDAATGDAQNQTRAEAHDLALKTAVSTALKRAATCLGDQYGLSLYAKGQTSALVKAILSEPKEDSDERSSEAVNTVAEPEPSGIE